MTVHDIIKQNSRISWGKISIEVMADSAEFQLNNNAEGYTWYG